MSETRREQLNLRKRLEAAFEAKSQFISVTFKDYDERNYLVSLEKQDLRVEIADFSDDNFILVIIKSHPAIQRLIHSAPYPSGWTKERLTVLNENWDVECKNDQYTIVVDMGEVTKTIEDAFKLVTSVILETALSIDAKGAFAMDLLCEAFANLYGPRETFPDLRRPD